MALKEDKKKNRMQTPVVVDTHPIFHAIRDEDKQRVDQLIDEDPSVLSVSSSRWEGTPLIYAILDAKKFTKGDEMALHIINHKPQQYWDVVTENFPILFFEDKGMTPLQAACWAEQPEIVKALVEHGADLLEDMTEDDCAPLHITVWRFSREAEVILAYLLSFPQVRETLSYDNANVSMIQLLLNAGADPTYPKELRKLYLGRHHVSSTTETISPLQIVQSKKLETSDPQAMEKFDKINQIFLASIHNSVRARLLFRVRFVAGAAKAISAASQDAIKRGLAVDEQRNKVFHATPDCLRTRWNKRWNMPSVVYNEPRVTRSVCECGPEIVALGDEERDVKKAYKVLRLGVDELPDDLFDDLMEMMVPPGDMAWTGEGVGEFLERMGTRIG